MRKICLLVGILVSAQAFSQSIPLPQLGEVICGIPVYDLMAKQQTQPLVSDRDMLIRDRVHAGIMGALGVGIVAYWIDFFTSGIVHTSEDQAYIDFERAFVLADSFIVACYLSGAALLWFQHPLSVLAGMAGGSAMIFLGFMDLLYNIQHQNFRNMTPEMAIETGIITISLSFGPATVLRLWKHRKRLSW